MGVLYLLGESDNQVDYQTQAKYLYDNKFNNSIVGYLDSIGEHYLYLSLDKGIIGSEEILEPYDVKTFESRDSFKVWGVCCYNLITDYCISNKINSIILLSNNIAYNVLEDLLSKNYSITNPIKCFSREDMMLRWLNRQIVSNIVEKYN